MADVEFTVGAKLGDLEKQLASIPNMTAEQAKAMTAELNRSIRSAEKAAKDSAKATKAAMKAAAEAARGAAEEAGRLGDKFGAIGSSGGKLAGALDMIAPGLGAVGQGIADLADVGEVAAGSLGTAAAPAVAVLGLAALTAGPYVAMLAAEMSREAEAARVAATANAFAAEQMRATEAAMLSASLAAGEITQLAYDEAVARATASDALGDYLKGLNEEIAAAREVELRNQAIVDSFASVIDRISLAGWAIRAWNKATGQSVPTVSELVNEAAKAVGITGQLAEAENNAAAATTRATEAAKRRRDAEIAAARAKADSAAASAKTAKASEAAKKADEEAAAQKRLTAEADRLAADAMRIEAEHIRKTSTETQNLERELAALQARQEALAEQGASVDIAGAELAIQAQIVDARLEAIAKLEEADKEARKRELERAEAARDEQIRVATEVAQSAVNITSYAADATLQNYQAAKQAQMALDDDATAAERKNAEFRVKEARKAAIRAFQIDKAAKLSQAIMAGAVAVQNALAIPPPAGLVLAAVVGANTAIQVATIASQQPTFHKGGLVGNMAPDEQSAVVRSGEAVLNPMGRRAIGDDQIRAANAGIGGSPMVVQMVYQHRVFDAFVADNLATRGPLARAIGGASRTGQRR